MRTFRNVLTIALGVGIAATLLFEASHYVVLRLLLVDDWVPDNLADVAVAALSDFSALSLVVWAVILASCVLVGVLLAGLVMALARACGDNW